MVAVTKALPIYLPVSAISFAAAFGGGGATILPFWIGTLAPAKGSIHSAAYHPGDTDCTDHALAVSTGYQQGHCNREVTRARVIE